MKNVERVGVIGAGTMGHGIAQVAAAAGCHVLLMDTTSELAERGVARIRANLNEGITRGKVPEAERDSILSRIATAVTPGADLHDRDLIVEAVPERMDLMLTLLKSIEPAIAADAIVASNTSSLSISQMQSALAQPRRMVGLHFFNPVHINRLVEIVRGNATDDDVVAASQAFVERIGKEAIVVRDSPGFATSRLGVLLGLEAIRMLEEGVASAQDIDRALELGYRHPVGPLKLTDLVGLDVRLDIARYLYAELGAEQFKPPMLLEQMVAQGKLGKKTGEGFYTW